MRISDWSSDVCSSDLIGDVATRTTFNDNVLLNGSVAAGFDIQTGLDTGQVVNITVADLQAAALGVDALDFSTAAGASAGLATLDTAIDTVATERANLGAPQNRQIGRASWRERVCQYV